MMSAFRRTWMLLLAAALPAAIACALQPASAPAPAAPGDEEPGIESPRRAGATAPAEEGESPDLVKSAVSYDELEEQVRFAVACGDKKELSQAAFEENRKHRNPFVRPFDRWDQILLFDRNGNGTISLGEALQYRAALRKALLAAYDADHDGVLTGEERLAANKALAEGKLPALSVPKPSLSPAAAAASQPTAAGDSAGAATQPEPQQ
jgi:hypothetical protein